MGKDLGRGPMDPSPHVGGASAPNDWGIKGIPPLSHDPLWVGQPHQIILKWVVRPTRGRMVGVGRFFVP